MASDKRQERPRRVLVMRFSALGDVALTIPVVYEVCRANPDVEFVFATMTWPATMMVDAPANLTVAIDQLLDDVCAVRKFMKQYRQIKMYHEPATSPVLYGN